MFSLQTNEAAIEEAKHQFASLPLPVIVLPNVLSPAWAKQLRARLETWKHFTLAHRGDYLYNDTFQANALFDELRTLTEKISKEKLQLRSFLWRKFLHRSYSLLRDDPPIENLVELQLDLSEKPIKDAELLYCHRKQIFAALPVQPGSLLIASRGLTVQKYQRYVTHLSHGEIFRLQLVFSINRSPTTI